MSFEIILLLAIIAVALILFSIEIVSGDIVALGILLILVLTGLLDTDQAFAGFGSETFILLLGLLVMTAALVRTGVVDIAGRTILRYVGDNSRRLEWVMMLSVAVLSAFISNTAATAFFIPIALGLAKRLKISPSILLMPLAFASILTSPVTLISSSSNIVVSGLIRRYDMPPIGMFELTKVGIPISIVGLAYMWFIGRRLIPRRAEEEDTLDQGGETPYNTEVVVLADSPLIGRPANQTGLEEKIDLKILRVGRREKPLVTPRGQRTIKEGDILLVEGQRNELLRIKDAAGIDFKVPDPAETYAIGDNGSSSTSVEAILLPGSPLIGQSIRRLQFRERFGIQVLGIHRSGVAIENKISRTRLRVGDQLILLGEAEKIALLGRNRNFRIISGLDEVTPTIGRAPRAVAIFIFSLALGSIGIIPLAVAVLIGAFLMLVTRTITPEEAYREVEWKALILIGSMLALGQAMEVTGTANFIAGGIVQSIGSMPAWVLLTAFFVLTLLLTQPMSNQAAAAVVIPVAIQTAVQLSLNPRTFAVMIAVAASASFMTPLEPSTMMVYGPGRYKFFDFLRVGLLLTVLIYFISIVLVPMFWPLNQ